MVNWEWCPFSCFAPLMSPFLLVLESERALVAIPQLSLHKCDMPLTSLPVCRLLYVGWYGGTMLCPTAPVEVWKQISVTKGRLGPCVVAAQGRCGPTETALPSGAAVQARCRVQSMTWLLYSQDTCKDGGWWNEMIYEVPFYRWDTSAQKTQNLYLKPGCLGLGSVLNLL